MVLTIFASFLLGLVGIFLEFFLPGGILGTIGALLLVFSIMMLFFSEISFFVVVCAIGVAILLVLATIKIALKKVQKGKFAMFLSEDQEGFRSCSEDLSSLIGKRGVTCSVCRPSGYVVVGNKKWQATSKFGFLENGENVIVTGKLIGQLLVEKERVS